MIDIVRILREQHPDLGPSILALRSRSHLVEPDPPARLRSEVRAWADENTPSARLHDRVVTYAATRGDPVEERSVKVIAFASAAELTCFALRWT